MKDRDILEHIKSGIDQAPINILENIKGQEVAKMMKHDDITRQDSRRSFKPIMSFASVAAVFLLVFFNIQQFRLPDSQIYLDINPGIQITTNKRDKVIDLTAINLDAIEIVEGIEYKNRAIKEVTEDILESLVSKNYIDDDEEIMLISVYNKDLEKSKKQATELNVVIHNKLDNNNKNPILLTQSLDKSNTVDDYAEKYGISVGKMTFIRNMIILNPELKTEDLVNLSLTELLEISRNTGIDIESILNSSNDERVTNPEYKAPLLNDDEYDDDFDDDDDDFDDDEYDDYDDDSSSGKGIKDPVKKQLIGDAKAKQIALGLVNGQIVEFKRDDDEYELKIVANGYEYEIEIDGLTGKVLNYNKDEIDEDVFNEDMDEDNVDPDEDDDDEYEIDDDESDDD